MRKILFPFLAIAICTAAHAQIDCGRLKSLIDASSSEFTAAKGALYKSDDKGSIYYSSLSAGGTASSYVFQNADRTSSFYQVMATDYSMYQIYYDALKTCMNNMGGSWTYLDGDNPAQKSISYNDRNGHVIFLGQTGGNKVALSIEKKPRKEILVERTAFCKNINALFDDLSKDFASTKGVIKQKNELGADRYEPLLTLLNTTKYTNIDQDLYAKTWSYNTMLDNYDLPIGEFIAIAENCLNTKGLKRSANSFGDIVLSNGTTQVRITQVNEYSNYYWMYIEKPAKN